MKWRDANQIVEDLRRQTALYLPGLSKRRGFSSSRVEHLLNGLVRAMPQSEVYLEVGVLEGRTLEAAAYCNEGKKLIGLDPCEKYEQVPDGFPPHIEFHRLRYQDFQPNGQRFGVAFYDGDHSARSTWKFLSWVREYLADEAVVIIDDWDRESVREGTFAALEAEPRFALLREMPEYTDGLTTAPHHFGYQFGIGVLGWKR